MTSDSPPSTLQAPAHEVERAAAAVLSYGPRADRPVWRRLFAVREGRRFTKHVYGFVHALGQVRRSHSRALSSTDLAEIRDHVEAVIQHIEQRLEADRPSAREGIPIVTAIYKIRERFEEIARVVNAASTHA